jgi:hypothetical protein
MYTSKDVTPEVAKRVSIEKRIVKATIKTLIKAGRTLAVGDGYGDIHPPSRNASDIYKDIMEMDEDTLYVYIPDGPAGRLAEEGFVQFIYGNDGYDVIADHTTKLEAVLAPVIQLADSLSK